MALIQTGSIKDFSVQADERLLHEQPIFKSFSRVNEFYHAAKTIPADLFKYKQSVEPRGIALKSIKLTKGFEGFLANMLKSTNEIYFLAWAWDLSGKQIQFYPGVVSQNAIDKFIIPLKKDKERSFMGAGINLFPQRIVMGGIVLRIQIWESDKDLRTFGTVLAKTAEKIKKSELANLLSTITMLTGVSGATVSLVSKASCELAGVIGNILEANSDDHVDLYEGYFPSGYNWSPNDEKYEGHASEITITKY